MTREEFMDLLRYYFRKADPKEVEEILADYEAHFEEGKAAGLSEEEISKELGSPKEIYETYAEEGMVKEKKTVSIDSLAEKAGEAAEAAKDKAKETWQEVSPKLPETVDHATEAIAKGFRIVCGIMAVLIAGLTLLIVFLLSMQVQPGMGLDALPVFSPVTLIAIGCTGFFSALAVYFIGDEGYKLYGSKKEQITAPADEKEEEK